MVSLSWMRPLVGPVKVRNRLLWPFRFAEGYEQPGRTVHCRHGRPHTPPDCRVVATFGAAGGDGPEDTPLGGRGTIRQLGSLPSTQPPALCGPATSRSEGLEGDPHSEATGGTVATTCTTPPRRPARSPSRRR